MQPPFSPDGEQVRLASLAALRVLDTEPEPVFDQIVQLAAELSGAPIALLSLVDRDRQWFKAAVGLEGMKETPRDLAFTNLDGQYDLVEVPDATLDPRFARHPLVTGEPHVRFYLGVPLVMPDGARVGTLCVVDRQPRQLDEATRRALAQVAALASRTLEMRRDLLEKALALRSEAQRALERSETRYRRIVEDQSELVSLSDRDGTLVYVNPAYARCCGRRPAELVGARLYDFVDPADCAALRERLDRVLMTGVVSYGESRMRAADGQSRWIGWTNGRQLDESRRPLLHSVGRDVTDQRRAEEALRASQDFLFRTNRVAGVGGWQIDLRTRVLHWSEETRRIHEVDDDFQPTLENSVSFFPGLSRDVVTQAVRRGMREGQGWDIELPFVTARGRRGWVRAVGEVEYEDGHLVRLVGALQDITERRGLQERLAENERFLRQITDSLPVRIAYVDRDLRYRFVNREHALSLGRSREEILGRRRDELKPHHAARDGIRAALAAALAGEPQRHEFEDMVDGKAMRIQAQLTPDIAADGTVQGVYVTSSDITADTEVKAALVRQSAALRSITEAIPALVAVVGNDRRYRFVNSAFERWFGFSRDAVIGREMSEVLGPDYQALREPWVARVLAGETVSFEEAEGQAAGSRHLSLTYVPLRLESGEQDGFVAVGHDITQHRHEEVRLLQLSRRDPLTGLLNRMGFEHWLEQTLQDESAGARLAVLYIDLDRFKLVNDQHGHAVGDELLKQFAQRIARRVRPGDAVARLGGDEFAIAIAGVSEASHLQRVAEEVLQSAKAPFEVRGSLQLNVGASVGIAHGTDGGGWRELVARADAMLYRAKAGGRGRYAGLAPDGTG